MGNGVIVWLIGAQKAVAQEQIDEAERAVELEGVALRHHGLSAFHRPKKKFLDLAIAVARLKVRREEQVVDEADIVAQPFGLLADIGN